MEGQNMKKTRINSGKQVKNHVSRLSNSLKKLKLWQKIFIGFVCVLGLIFIGVTFWNTLSRKNSDPYFEISVTAPTPSVFDNAANTNFVGPGALPEPNNNREISKPGELVILYDQASGDYTPAIRMDLSNDDIAKNIKISPAIAGTWGRRGPNALVFQPTHELAPDVKFTVKINKNIFNPDIRVSARQITFKTPDITATVESLNTYPAAQRKSVIGAAVISFNYPVDTKKVADRIKMRLDGHQMEFDVKFDRFHRTAIITSAPIEITKAPQVLRIKMNRIPAATGDAMTQKITANTTIESADNIFKISGLETTVADDTGGLPQQLLLINMTSQAAADTKWDKYVEVFLLPKYRDDNADKTDAPYKWATDEITDTVLNKSKKLALKKIDFENPTGVYQYALAYDVSDKTERFIYAKIKPGFTSAADFSVKDGTARVLAVPYPRRSVKIAGSGALLALGGERKLGITARGGADAAYVNLYKVKSSEINHLISQTYNVFGAMEFKSWSFDAFDMSVVFKKRIGFADTSLKHVNYASVDLGDYLDRTHSDKTGIFIVQTGPTQSQADYSDRRLILLTDLGIVRKVNLDQSSTVFISNLTAGTPGADIEVYVLGRNGNSVWAGRTDNDGHVNVPALPWSEYKNEKAPVAIVARRGDDVSFIPYDSSYERRVEYSKFDTDGVYASAGTSLNAFMFTDRGIYRPGESVIIGGIVKRNSFAPIPGIPVKLEIRDSRGRLALEKMFSLTADGMFDVTYDVPAGAPLGEYNAQLFSLNAKNKPQDILGYTSLRIEEFSPDNLKISATLPGTDDAGWLTPAGLRADVSLRNLFGTPAAEHRIAARAILTPAPFSFGEFPGYKFTDNFISGTGLSANSATKTITREFEDIQTDANGHALIDVDIEQNLAENATYAFTVIVQGFEAGSGRSVQTSLRGRVSNAKYLVGWHANSDLSYINRGAARSVNIIAIDHTAKRTTASDVTMRLMRRENLTSLVKDGAGYYKYQTVTQDKLITQDNISIPERGLDINLDTSAPGTYYLQITDAGGRMLANIEYFVAGASNSSLESDTRAELQIKLNSTSYAPGDKIAVGITAPYAGYGLLTIERDKVYAYQWFKMSSTSSVEYITVPAGFEGTGYINVSFVRDINSRDVFTTPYAYAVAPFMADTARRTIGVKLQAPATISDSKLTVKYETNRDARLMLFAVNEGILQVARYQTPNPMAHFFKKAALQVETYQILSLILPEYKILHEFAKTGGGDYNEIADAMAGIANPFARRTDKPVAFYSKIINATANKTGSVTFDIPDSFNGTLRVFAVAAGESGIGSADTSVTVRHPLIVTINAPVAAAPGDKFDINAVVTNLTPEASQSQSFTTQATTSSGIEIKPASDATREIPSGGDALWTFRATAGDTLGSADININAHGGTTSAMGTATMSIRPATPFTTDIQIGKLDSAKTTLRPTDIPMYSDGARHSLYISYGADAVVRPLVEYLAHYEWTCTEQLTSRAMPYVAIGASEILGITYDAAAKKVADTITMLKNRQNDDGSFAMWAAGNTGRNNESDTSTAYITAYVVQFLNMAHDRGFNVPSDMKSRALSYLRTYAGTNIRDSQDAATHAFAIYVITANEFVTTAYISQFEEWANANLKNWESELAGAYIAAAYSIMRQDERATTLASKYKFEDNIKYTSQFNNTIANNAIYQYLSSRYFKESHSVPSLTKDQMKYINSGQYSSFTAAALILGQSGNIGTKNNISEILTVTADGVPLAGESKSGTFVAAIAPGVKKIEVKCPDCGTSVTPFWTIIKQGYPMTVAADSHGLELIREYYDMDGNRINAAKIGDRVKVKIFARARADVQNISNAVIIDLLPGGFIVDTDTLGGEYTFAETREDRIIIYTDISRTESVYEYTAQIGAAGTFAIAPIHGESMYNPNIFATGRGGTFTVKNESDD